MEVSGDVSATRPVEAPSAATEILPTGQDASLPFAADRHEVQPPSKKRTSTVTSPTVSVEEPASEAGNITDWFLPHSP